MNQSRHKAVYQFLSEYGAIKNKYFNFSISENNTATLLPANAYTDSPIQNYSDGTQLRYYDFTVMQYKAVSTEINSEENIEILEEISDLARWIDKCGEDGIYPPFPEDCTIIDMYALPADTAYIADADEHGVNYVLKFRIEYLCERK